MRDALSRSARIRADHGTLDKFTLRKPTETRKEQSLVSVELFPEENRNAWVKPELEMFMSMWMSLSGSARTERRFPVHCFTSEGF